MKFVVAFLVATLCGVCFAFSSADFNSDGFVDFGDLAILAGQWLSNEPNAVYPTDLNQDNTVDFTDFALFAAQWQFEPDITFTISGTTGVDGVIMNGLPGNTVTSSGGLYSAVVPYGWNGIVAPTKAGYNFNPPHRTYTKLITDQNAQDYTGTQVFIISGSVWMDGVTMRGLPGDPVAGSGGFYSAAVPSNWSGTVIPTRQGYTFDPTNRSYTDVTADMSGQDYMGTPTEEDTNDPNRLTFTRPSIAYDDNMVPKDINSPRTKLMCVANRPVLHYNSSRGLTGSSVDGNCVLVISGSLKTLYTTQDGTTLTKILSIDSNQPFSSDYSDGYFISSVQAVKHGVWLLCMGSNTTATSGYLYRTTDGGQSWSKVLTMDRGYMGIWGWSSWSPTRADYIAVGEYAYDKFQSDNPRRIYLSTDAGITWQMVYDPGAASGQHCHDVVFSPFSTDVLYASYGDDGTPSYATIKKITKDANGVWTGTDIRPGSQPTAILTRGNYLYFGHDGTGRDATLEKFDPLTEHFSLCGLILPRTEPTTPDTPYRSLYGPDVFGQIIYNGVHYVLGYDAYDGGTRRFTGIYVSPDSEHWTRIYTISNAKGFKYIAGYANGYIWGTFEDSYGTSRLFWIEPVSARLVESLRVERGIVNRIDSPDASSFENSTGGWLGDTRNSNLGLCTLSTEVAKSGIGSYKLVSANNGRDGGNAISSTLASLGGLPSKDDYICVSAWFYLLPTWPKEFAAKVTLNSQKNIVVADGSTKLLPGEWQRVTTWAKCNGSPHPLERILVRITNTPYDGDYTNAALYVDCVQAVYFHDMHYSRVWQIGGTPREDEYTEVSLNGFGSAFSLAFNWHPDCASAEWHGNCPIATIHGKDGSYLYIYFDPIQSDFVITNGTSEAVIQTGGNGGWEFLDQLKFAVVSNCNNVRLYIQNPLYGTAFVDTPIGCTLTSLPSSLVLSSNSDQTITGVGLFNNLKGWSAVLSDSEIDAVFNDVEPSVPTFAFYNGKLVVPNVIGQTQAAATTAITAVDSLTVGTITTAYSDAIAAGLVISQNPVGGTVVNTGSSVDIVVSLGLPVIPDVTGQAQAAAEAAITTATFTVGNVTTAHSDTVAAGLVISQSLVGGTAAVSGTAVDMVVSLGLPIIPDITGQAQTAAEAAITAATFTVGNVTTAYSDTVATGNVISQSPVGGSAAASGTAVDMVVSLGLPIIPDVTGQAQAAAEAAITAATFTVGGLNG